jgi:hypothetical protein
MKKMQSSKKSGKQQRVNERYTRLAMSSLNQCNRSIEQFRTISVLVASVLRKPAITDDERRAEHTVLSLLMETVDGYERDAETYRELLAAVATDARDLPDTRLSADDALLLMESIALPAQHEPQDMRACKRSRCAKA